ncbi:DUF1249 domain-containing protein [Pseudohongiella spirulinae]|uniref:Cytoplasmic protein n=1 Tax=Pseudohongiella spirulinae TaxID=1249552 RepID=A0A0S2KAB2_9GAMM|nr:DUF1249 domain-containing protein [Pseudohongiella spirulinae]ALO45061.1 hypothetical protein PS2015_372 [Pseudohongiella spirulinae]
MFAAIEQVLHSGSPPARYRVDLAAYMRTCDANYRRLLRLIPGLESNPEHDSWRFPLADSRLQLVVRLKEEFTYTSTLEVSMESANMQWPDVVRLPVIEVRLYHDACTAEPVSYQGRRRIPVRSEVPNRDMYHQDEKRQINELLAECLRLCRAPGVSVLCSDRLCTD